MLKKLLVVAILCGLPVFAQTPLPKPRDGGDYWLRDEETWIDWEVTCPELAGRLTPAWPQDEGEPGALLKVDWLVPQWPVISKFGKGERLQAVPDEVGGILIKDIDGGTWMKVASKSGGFCFVRANGKYLRPVVKSAVVASPALPSTAAKPAQPPEVPSLEVQSAVAPPAIGSPSLRTVAPGTKMEG